MSRASQNNGIESPCVQICVIHPQERICVGCYRTADEITQWTKYSDEQRHHLMQTLPDRASRLKKRRGGRARNVPDLK